MNTDQIIKALGKKAIDRERDTITRAANTYNQALGLAGTVAAIKITGKDGTTTEIYTSDIFKQICDQLIEKRSETIIANEVRNFMSSVEQFSNHVTGLNEYLGNS
jgi:hypothetical protein